MRPFGVSLLVAGWDVDAKRPYLYQCDPSVSYSVILVPDISYGVPFPILMHLFIQGAYFAWKATALGKNYVNGKTFLEKR